MAESIGCSSLGRWLNSQHSLGSSQPPIAPVSGDSNTIFCPPWEGAHTGRLNTNTHKIKTRGRVRVDSFELLILLYLPLRCWD